ncbi:TolC family protein [Phocaeicola vulgatus]|uniref:TolC family protein n=1 Tax=Phocaeicola vulgatus TaxID=821 RepID=UPI0021669D99|nr:TolC family protein [Phocaeicola vulgatus]MCS2749102.1 TolC family protein [Phocaeicola vulgatus]
MKRLTFILVIVGLIFYSEYGYAQEKKWTLSECIDYAVTHNIEVKQSDNQIQNLKVEKNTLRYSFLPDLNAGASQNFTFGRSLNQSNTYENSNIQNSSFSVSTEIPIFMGFKRTASISQNKFDLLAAEANKELIKNNLLINVAGAYFQILLNKEIYNIALEQIQLTKEQEACTKILIDNGKAAESQLYDVRAQLADDELTATEARNSLRLSFLDLVQLMELDEYDEFDIDSIDGDIAIADTLSPVNIYQSALTCMPQIRQAYYALQSKTKGIKIAKSGFYPTISFVAGMSTNYYNNNSALYENFRKQFNNNMQKSLCLTVSIPLFDRFSTRNKVRSARIEENNARLSLDNEKKQLYKDIEQAYTDVISAYEKYRSTTKAVMANEEAHRYALEKYAAGKSTVFEYNEIKMKLADALSQQSQAKYTYLLKDRILAFYSCFTLTD